MSVGSQIQNYRKERGLSQQELGAKLGVTGSMIGQYESGLRKPKVKTLVKIAAALNVNPIYLTKGDLNYPVVAVLTLDAIQEDLIKSRSETKLKERFLESFNKLNTEGQQKAVDYVEDLAKVDDYLEYKNSDNEKT